MLEMIQHGVAKDKKEVTRLSLKTSDFGLSYSTFQYSNLQLSATEIPVNGTLTARVSLKNSSKTDGLEVVQLYVQDIVGSIARPVKKLKGFQKVFLKAGG